MQKDRRRQPNTIPAWLGILARGALCTVALALVTITVAPSLSGGIVNRGSSRTGKPAASDSTTTTSPTTTTSTITTSTTTTAPANPSTGLITTGASRRECVDPNFTDTGFGAVKAAVAKFDSVTHTTVTCLSAYLNGEPNWTQWEHPWITSPQYGYTDWVAQAPQRRQLVLEVDLIPASLANVEDPLSWEQSCASGDFNSYATDLGTNLVAAGLQNSVIRLGPEMNGIWEEDYVGPTATEQRLWATCFANEVTALRQAPGEHFLMDWDVNACTQNIPYANFYPGNAYVDILGLDIYDVSCTSPYTPESFTKLANEVAGISSFERFAAARKLPMSFPEWGLKKVPAGDDPGYIAGMGAIFDRRDVSFEVYFNVDVKIRPYLALGTGSPLSLKAFTKWFGKN